MKNAERSDGSLEFEEVPKRYGGDRTPVILTTLSDAEPRLNQRGVPS